MTDFTPFSKLQRRFHMRKKFKWLVGEHTGLCFLGKEQVIQTFQFFAQAILKKGHNGTPPWIKKFSVE